MFILFLRRLRWPLLAAVAAALITASLAGATHLGYLQLGHTNNAGANTTALTGTPNAPVLNVVNGNTGTSAYGIVGNNNSSLAPAIGGGNSGVGPGFRGISTGGVGVLGIHSSASGSGPGVLGRSDASSGGWGVQGSGGFVNVLAEATGSTASRGVEGLGSFAGIVGFGGTWAGFFSGSVNVDGNLNVAGTLTKGSGAFKIDHPLDPAHKYLQHSFVESPDMLNVYNGNVTTDVRGFATVQLPSYFQALNRDFRYQLTVIGRTFARAIVWEEIANNRFTLRTDEPDVQVSWQVTGVRRDAYANAHRIKVVVPKRGKENGTYLYPRLYGKEAGRSLMAATGPKPATQLLQGR